MDPTVETEEIEMFVLDIFHSCLSGHAGLAMGN